MTSGNRPPSGSSPSVRSRTPTPPRRTRAQVGSLVSQAMDEIRANAARQPPKRRRKAPWVVTAVVLSFAALWLWFARPGFVLPDAAAGASVQQQRDALIVLIDATAGRVEAFRLANRRLPESATEFGLAIPDLQYRRVSEDVYELSGSIAGTPISYQSTMDRVAFAAAARQNLGVSR